LHEIICTVFETIRKAEISDDNVAVTIEEKVFKLEITMDDFLLVDIPDTGYELREKFCGISFPQIAVGKDMVEKFATRGVLKDDTDVLVCFNDIV
jgi:hypothetical protein